MDERARLLLRTCSVLALALAAPAGCVSTGGIDTSAMSFSSEPLVGKIVWNDLVTDDLEAARRFYGGLFGWTFENSTTRGARSYLLAKSGKVYVAGLVSVAPHETGKEISRWLPYVSVPDVDAAAGRATASNGRIAVPAQDVSLGRVATIIDPEGAVIGLARSRIGDPDDATTKAAAGRVVWTELLTNDPQAAAAFYHSVIGYEPRTIDRRGGQYTLLTAQGAERAGILKNPTEQWDPVWLTYFGVEDPAAATARAESLGGRVLLRASPEVREGTIAIVADPSGAILVLRKASA
jgi:predicted enzyme related to lactoylglutathione lyase